MKKIHLALLMFFIVAPLTFFVACSKDDEPSTEKVSEIAGNWTATKATFNGVDVVSEGGSVTLAIESNSKFMLSILQPGKTDMVFTGKLGFDEEWLVMVFDVDPDEYNYYDYNYDANNFHIGANAEFDFDQDGTDEYVIFFLDMVR